MRRLDFPMQHMSLIRIFGMVRFCPSVSLVMSALARAFKIYHLRGDLPRATLLHPGRDTNMVTGVRAAHMNGHLKSPARKTTSCGRRFAHPTTLETTQHRCGAGGSNCTLTIAKAAPAGVQHTAPASLRNTP